MDTMEKITTAFITLMFIFVGGVMVLGPITEWNSAGVLQKQLNAQCGTNYSQIDVLLSGNELMELCKVKNQELLIKQ